MALQWAQNIKEHPNLDEALDINEVNILTLLDEIRELKKEIKELKRDNDVLYFDLCNWKPEEPERKKGKCCLTIED
jgi:hypothetical protein